MPAYYFAMEGYHTGENPDPATDTLITIQYQKIDLPSGEQLEKLVILKAWETSEKSIVTAFYNQFLRPEVSPTRFIPVGIDLDYAYEMIIAKCKQYHLSEISSHRLYYERPRLDLGPVLVLLNDGRFAGARLDAFSSKKSDARRINKWYENKEFKPIERTLHNEAEAFLKLFQYVSKYKTRLGIARKGKTAHEKPAETPLPLNTEPTLPLQQESQAPSGKTPAKRAETRKLAPHNNQAHLAKAHTRSRPTSDETPSPDRKPTYLNPLRKHTPKTKNDKNPYR